MTKKKMSPFVKMCTGDNFGILEQVQYYYEGLWYKYLQHQGIPVWAVAATVVPTAELEKANFVCTKEYDEYVEHAIEHDDEFAINLEFKIDSSG